MALGCQYVVQRLPVRHLLPRLVVRPDVADGGVQFRPLLGLVLGLEQVPHGAEAVGVALAGFGQKHECRTRVTQVMNLLQLAPEILEALLFMPRTERDRDPIRERHIRPIATELDWRRQRECWGRLN